MSKLLIYSLLGLFLMGLQPISAENVTNRTSSYSYRYEKWSADNKESGLFESGERVPINETGLLLQLSKGERQKFRSLSFHARQDVLEFVNETGTHDYCLVIDEAVQRESSKIGFEQEKMLHNGMNRIQSGKRG